MESIFPRIAMAVHEIGFQHFFAFSQEKPEGAHGNQDGGNEDCRDKALGNGELVHRPGKRKMDAKNKNGQKKDPVENRHGSKHVVRNIGKFVLAYDYDRITELLEPEIQWKVPQCTDVTGDRLMARQEDFFDLLREKGLLCKRGSVLACVNS
jgi:hypothetical protein